MGNAIKVNGKIVRCRGLANCLGLMVLSMWVNSAMTSSKFKDSINSMMGKYTSEDGTRVNNMGRESSYLEIGSKLGDGYLVIAMAIGSKR